MTPSSTSGAASVARRVAHVATAYGVPSETFVPDAVEAVDTAGWESWVFTLAVRSRDRFPFPPDERLVVAPSPSRPRRGVDRLRGRSGPGRFTNDVAAQARRAAPSVVHAHFGWAAHYGFVLAARLEVPFVATFHASDVTSYPGPPPAQGTSAMYAAVFPKLHSAIVVSHFVEGKLRALGWDGPVAVIPPGVHLDRFPMRAVVPSGPPRLLFVGRLVTRKGPDLVIKAFAEVRRTHPDAALSIVGEGPERAALQRLAATLGVAHAVRFFGVQSPLGVRAALEAAHVLLLPSRTMPDGEIEGSPVILKEAMAVGVPVVATRHAGIPEVIPPGQRSDLVPEEDVEGLARRVTGILSDASDQVQLGAQGRGWVEEQFDVAALGLRTAAVYEELVSCQSAPSS